MMRYKHIAGDERRSLARCLLIGSRLGVGSAVTRRLLNRAQNMIYPVSQGGGVGGGDDGGSLKSRHYGVYDDAR